MNSVQSRMARAALQLGIRDLAKAAKVSSNTISRLESGEELRERTADDVRRAFEVKGVRFIEDDEWVGVAIKRVER